MPGSLVAPAFGVSVVLAKTEDISQEVPLEEDFWVAGLEWIESLGADIASSSLSYFDWYEFADLDGEHRRDDHRRRSGRGPGHGGGQFGGEFAATPPAQSAPRPTGTASWPWARSTSTEP